MAERIYQIECQIEYHIECQIACQKECQVGIIRSIYSKVICYLCDHLAEAVAGDLVNLRLLMKPRQVALLGGLRLK